MFRRFSDESEIEEWLEEEKQKLNERLYDASYAKKDVEKVKKQYDEKFSALLRRYNKEHENLKRRTERRRRVREPVVQLRQWWRRLSASTKQTYTEARERRQKRKFNKEYEKLMGR